jgi:hypothetical protein
MLIGAAVIIWIYWCLWILDTVYPVSTVLIFSLLFLIVYNDSFSMYSVMSFFLLIILVLCSISQYSPSWHGFNYSSMLFLLFFSSYSLMLVSDSFFILLLLEVLQLIVVMILLQHSSFSSLYILIAGFLLTIFTLCFLSASVCLFGDTDVFYGSSLFNQVYLSSFFIFVQIIF